MLLDSFEFRNHLFFTFPVVGVNLYDFIKQRSFQGCSMSFVRSVAIQLLEALVHFRTLGVIHCDLKLENILVEDARTAKVVIIDFGSSCFASNPLYSYLQSRFYRAPEVIMGLPYSYEIDLWSTACMLPELRSGRPAFPGNSEHDQLACISEVLHEPPKHMVDACKRRDLFDDGGSLVALSPNRSGSRRVDQLIKARAKDKHFVDFLGTLLRWDPGERASPVDALRHPFLN